VFTQISAEASQYVMPYVLRTGPILVQWLPKAKGKNSAVVFAGGRRTRSGPQSARAHSLTTSLWGSDLGTPGYELLVLV